MFPLGVCGAPLHPVRVSEMLWLPLQVSRARLDKAWSSLGQGEVSLPWQVGLEQDDL